jgi:hypothetical protein
LPAGSRKTRPSIFGAGGDRVGDEAEAIAQGGGLDGAAGGGQPGVAVTTEGDGDGRQAATERARREGGDARRLDGAVEGRVPGGEVLVV